MAKKTSHAEREVRKSGTVKTVDAGTGQGLIQPDGGGPDLPFKFSVYAWDNLNPPPKGQRVTYVEARLDKKRTEAIQVTPA